MAKCWPCAPAPGCSHILSPITVVVLTCDEEDNLRPLLESVFGWVDEIFIVDSGSTDGTLAIAEEFGTNVFPHDFTTHQAQWKWAVANLPIETDWVLGLDADQRITPELRRELKKMFPEGTQGPAGVNGLYINRRQVFRGKWIKHGTYYPKYLLKLFRRDSVRFDELDLIDHHFHVDGPTEKLQNDLIEDNAKERDISFWVSKHVRYAGRVAEEEFLRRQEGHFGVEPKLFGNPDQRTAWFKRSWYRLPLYVRPFLYFGYRYFVRLGFLDGRQGLVFHFLHGLWYRLMIDVHLDDMLSGKTAGEGGPA
ncbi:MAG: glycosyltransferase family 2 protein [Gemmatimonadota bacterium]|nr:glycosyltransferase family 2 protein [Gemmatimonadota bacterium]